MCQHITILAQRGERFFVGQCEHGTIHLVWGPALLRLRPNDVEELTQNLIRCLDHDDIEPMHHGRFRLFCTSHGALHLWIGIIGIYLTRIELTTFVHMLDEACCKRARAQHHAQRPGLSDEFHILRLREQDTYACN